jgi:serine/threonine protein kinase
MPTEPFDVPRWTAGDVALDLGHRFRPESRLAESSYGEIWRARWLQTGRAVALKIARPLPAGHSLRTLVDAALRREAQVLGALRHAHLARLLAAGNHDNRPVLVLEELSATLERSPPAAPLVALDWTRQVAAGVSALHRAGWRHLDLKPANLLFTAGSDAFRRIKLVDFGTCRSAAEGEHEWLGTIGWMAPEQLIAVDGEQARFRTDARSDVYALGLLLFHFLTGASTAYGDAQRAAFRAQAGRGPLVGAARWQGGPSAADEQALLRALKATATPSPPRPIAATEERQADAYSTWRPDPPQAPPAAVRPPAATRRDAAVLPHTSQSRMVLGLLRRLLAHEPRERPSDAAEAGALIERVMVELRANRR